MNRQVLRSVCSRAKPELPRAPYTPSNYFSTTRRVSAEGDPTDGAPKPTNNRPRSRVAIDEISSLLNEKKPSTASPDQRPRPSPNQQSGAAPNVLDVRSLPRGFRGRGGLQGRGGGMSARGGRFGPSSRGSAARGGRGGPGGRGRGRGRAGARGGKRRGGGEEEGEGKEKRSGRMGDEYDIVEAAEEEYDNAMRFGVNTVFNPSVTRESLADHMPAWPTTPVGRAASALQNLSILAGRSQTLPNRNHPMQFARKLRNHGAYFFPNAQEREVTEQAMQELWREQAQRRRVHADKIRAQAKGEPLSEKAEHNVKRLLAEADRLEAEAAAGSILQLPNEAVRQTVVDRAIAGKYEEPKLASDPVGIARNLHVKSETYSARETRIFEEKLRSLIERTGGKPGPAGKQGQLAGKS